ncbi:ABC transporter substrate-binding protein [Cellulomonas gilvus]|uniref:Extracellular solute-binding protein family 1 n=1 Tax=Cellulomonas gilvus (strain ATCC 13127 / NRRL B-14078) TaxID=593907 RepID=F8A389_CELGA|nr:sugar ABC transporter substrate-binding protein [Cellulomonas gilvus]AEI13082.1 extracellular solute-binding protein family 1 [Cellulomonas gilvus ATCC 13127]
MTKVHLRGRTRLVAGLAVAGIALAGLTACSDDEQTPSPGESASGASSAEGVDDGTELTMWTRAPLEAQATRLVEAYNASHDNQIKLEIVPNDDMESKVGGAAANGELPDLLAGDVVRVPYWVENGLFTEITDNISALPYKDDISSGHIDAGTLDGAQHTLPFVQDISVMVWNKDLYKEAGLDPEAGPTTLAEFQEQAQAVADLKKDGVSGTYYGGNCGGCLVFTWFPTIWASGDEVISEDGSQSLLASESAKALYETYAGLNESGAIGAGSKEENGSTWVAPFQNGNVGVMQYPNTVVKAAIDAGIDVGVGPIPGVDGGSSTFLGGDGMGISKDSEHVDQAWNFLAWMLSDDTQLNVVAKAGDVVSRNSLLENEFTADDPVASVAAQAIPNGRTPVAAYFAEAFNAAGSPWVTLIRNATFDRTDTVDADNDAITAILSQ